MKDLFYFAMIASSLVVALTYDSKVGHEIELLKLQKKDAQLSVTIKQMQLGEFK